MKRKRRRFRIIRLRRKGPNPAGLRKLRFALSAWIRATGDLSEPGLLCSVETGLFLGLWVMFVTLRRTDDPDPRAAPFGHRSISYFVSHYQDADQDRLVRTVAADLNGLICALFA
jgi:hypothetical protein